MADKPKQRPNWKTIALALAQRVNFACTVQLRGSPIIYNVKTGGTQHYLDYMADGLRMVPGIVIDDAQLDKLKRGRGKRAAKETPNG